MKDVNKSPNKLLYSNNFLNPKLSFPPQNLYIPTKFMLFLCLPNKVNCDTNKVTGNKMKKLTFSLSAMKFSKSRLSATPAVPTQTFFRLRINTYLEGKISLFFHQRTALCYMLNFFYGKME